MKKGRAFTLTELLIVAVIVAIIGGAGISLTYAFLQHEERVEDMTTASQRGEIVFSILEKPILHAGLGMPDEGADFQSAFTIGSSNLEIAYWDGPVSVAKDNSTEHLGVVYAVATSCAAASSYDIASGDVVEVSFEGELPQGQISGGNRGELKSWVAFPASELPFFVESVVDSRTLELSASGHAFIAKYDKLCLVRALKAYADSGFFYVEDVTSGSGAQPVVEGIAGARFSYDSAKRLVTVTILCRGAKRYDRAVTVSPPPPWEDALSSEDRHYRLIAMRRVWRIRN
jgi:prepilin-type N-terminal cleavage/methylation domain-containing protein